MNELLNAIDVINESVNDSELSVLESLSDVYTKSISILENYNGELSHFPEIFQESEIMDQAKGNPNESMIKRILLFIPRLIKAIFQKVFGKSKQTDQMAQQLINSDTKLKNDITIELTFGLDEDLLKVMGISDNKVKIGELIPTKLDTNQSFSSDDIKEVDEQISKFTNVLEIIKNKQKQKISLHRDESVKDTVSKISNRWTSALKWMHHYIKDINDTLNEANTRLQNQNDQTTTTYLGKVQKLVQVMGNVAATFENIYSNEIKPIYLNIFSESNPNLSENNNQNAQQVHRDVFEGEHWNSARLRQWSEKYKQQNPQEYYIKNGDNNQINFILSSNGKSIASISIDAGKVDKSLIPHEGKWIKGRIQDLKK